MKTVAWSCDWCGAELSGEPALQACIREPATGEFYLPMDGCQACLDKFITMLDPSVSERKKLGDTMGRTIRFRAFPGKMVCGCKSAVKCPHGGGV